MRTKSWRACSKRPRLKRSSPSDTRSLSSSSVISFSTNSTVTTWPSVVRTEWRDHCQSCAREISAVAASSMRWLIGTQPLPRSHDSGDWGPTLMFLRTPGSLVCGVAGASSRAAAGAVTGGARGGVVAVAVDLVVAADLRELLARDWNEPRVRHPRPVVSVGALAALVGAHRLQRGLVRVRVALDRDLRRHPAHRVGAAAVARADRQQRIRAHERRRHRHQAAVRQHEPRVPPELLDQAEDVVPAPAVQAGRMVAQLEE